MARAVDVEKKPGRPRNRGAAAKLRSGATEGNAMRRVLKDGPLMIVLIVWLLVVGGAAVAFLWTVDLGSQPGPRGEPESVN